MTRAAGRRRASGRKLLALRGTLVTVSADDGHRSMRPLSVGIRRAVTLGPHVGRVGKTAWSPGGSMIAVSDESGAIVVWHVESGVRRRALFGVDLAQAVAFDPSGRSLASVSQAGDLVLWDIQSGGRKKLRKGQKSNDIAYAPSRDVLVTADRDNRARLWTMHPIMRLAHEFVGHSDLVTCVTFDSSGELLATASLDCTIKIWDAGSGKLLSSREEHRSPVLSVAFGPDGMLASAGNDLTIKLWSPRAERLLTTIEGHTDVVRALSISADGRLLAAGSRDGSLWLRETETGDTVATVAGCGGLWQTVASFHPSRALLARVGDYENLVDVLEVDADAMLEHSRSNSITYTSAKIVLVGDSGVGKTGLGWRLAHGRFREHASTHGQQFWLLDDLGTTRGDGALCEAVLWDLAGQPDYRLIHALFLDDADLAVVLFDPTRDDDPLHSVDYWLRQLGISPSRGDSSDAMRPSILVAARSDRGAPRLTAEEIETFRTQRGVGAVVTTSALTGEGLEDLLARMRQAIRWDERPTTVTTATFKQIKDYVLSLKERVADENVILSLDDLRERLERDQVAMGFSDSELQSAVGHLSNHGYVTRLRTSKGAARILLAPDLLNNVAASIVLEARRNPRGLGSLEEQRVLAGNYRFLELDVISAKDMEVLLDSAIAMFLDRNLCFRQTDPLSSRVYLVFPELINLKRPPIDDGELLEEAAAYTAAGAVENLYASLVVLLGYTSTFRRTNQWRDHAHYVVGDGLVCGFRLEAEREGELDFVLYFGTRVGPPIRTLFQSLFESFLARSKLTVRRYEPVICSQGHTLNRAAVREQVAQKRPDAFCTSCGERVLLPSADTPIALTAEQAEDLRGERREVVHRSRFEQAMFRLNAYLTQEGTKVPSCFVSYARGMPGQERWVLAFANDLVKAGLVVVLDRWENERTGASIARFVERIGTSDRVIVVGTPLYRLKYDNRETIGHVAAAEGDLIGVRMLGTEKAKKNVHPVLLEGTSETSFPPLLHGRVYADFRDQGQYFRRVLDLLVSIYEVEPRDPINAELDRLVDSAP